MNFLINKIKEIFNFLFNLIYKQKCCICDCLNADYFLCKSCLKNINLLSGFPHRIIDNIKIYSVCLYDDIPKKIIHNYKFKNKLDLRFIISKLMADYFKNYINENVLVIGVPSYKDRIKKRGYNHIEEIVKEFSSLCNLKNKNNLLIKIKPTKPHYKLNKNQREKNIEGSFKINIDNYKGEKILIIDDLITTGATVNEVIKEFKKNNINNLIVLTFCKTFN